MLHLPTGNGVGRMRGHGTRPSSHGSGCLFGLDFAAHRGGGSAAAGGAGPQCICARQGRGGERPDNFEHRAGAVRRSPRHDGAHREKTRPLAHGAGGGGGNALPAGLAKYFWLTRFAGAVLECAPMSLRFSNFESAKGTTGFAFAGVLFAVAGCLLGFVGLLPVVAGGLLGGAGLLPVVAGGFLDVAGLLSDVGGKFSAVAGALLAVGIGLLSVEGWLFCVAGAFFPVAGEIPRGGGFPPRGAVGIPWRTGFIPEGAVAIPWRAGFIPGRAGFPPRAAVGIPWLPVFIPRRAATIPFAPGFVVRVRGLRAGGGAALPSLRGLRAAGGGLWAGLAVVLSFSAFGRGLAPVLRLGQQSLSPKHKQQTPHIKTKTPHKLTRL